MGQAFSAWQATVNTENPDGDLNAALELVESSGIPETDKQEVESELTSRITNRRAENKIKLETQKDEEIGNINQLLYIDENYSGASKAVQDSPFFTNKEKKPLLKEINTLAKAANNQASDFTTGIPELVIIEKIIDQVAGGVDVLQGVEAYNKISSKVKATENKTNIQRIFDASEQAKDDTSKQNTDILVERKKYLRDSIESQPNLFEPDIATEILRDFANQAIIEISDRFRNRDFKKDDLDREVNTLINKYRLNESQQSRAVIFRELQLAESLKQQTVNSVKLLKSLREEGRNEEAEELEDEFKALGILEVDENGKIVSISGDKVDLSKKKSGGFSGKTIINRILRR
jgi:hypothetical protein